MLAIKNILESEGHQCTSWDKMASSLRSLCVSLRGSCIPEPLISVRAEGSGVMSCEKFQLDISAAVHWILPSSSRFTEIVMFLDHNINISVDEIHDGMNLELYYQ